MAFFSKKDDKKPSTLEEVQRAYENLSDDDKASFHQSIADRVHESVAAQEREHGQEDSQSAEAREHESLGEEHAEGEGDVEELHDEDDTAEEKREDAEDEVREDVHEEQSENRESDDIKALREEIAKLSARLDLVERTPQKADSTTADKLEKLANQFNN